MYPGSITTESMLQLCYSLRLHREFCKVKTSFLTAGLVLDQRKRRVLFNILLGLFFIFCFSTIISKCHMTVFFSFESSLLDPNKLNRIFKQFIIVTVAIFLHLWNSLKKNFEELSWQLRLGARNYGLSFLGPVYMEVGEAGYLTYLGFP